MTPPEKADADRTAALDSLARRLERLTERADKLAQPERRPDPGQDQAHANIIPIPPTDYEAERKLKRALTTPEQTNFPVPRPKETDE